ncbi:MAG: hypothetical protein QG661_370 [Actinomycetota bacterium]|jgi:hypothetical protein|nr:hypothetical protein [Actinomycetota bacterium]
MTATAARTGLALATLGVASALLLSACTSEPGADLASLDASSSSAAAGDTASPSESGTAVPGDAAVQACAAYFELDLLNSTYAGGAVADGDMTEAQVRADFQRLLRIMVAQGTIAVADGQAGQKLLANATRMKKAVKGLAKGQALSDLTKKQQTKFALQSSRVEKACARAGLPLPDDNTIARTAAGI